MFNKHGPIDPQIIIDVGQPVWRVSCLEFTVINGDPLYPPVIKHGTGNYTIFIYLIFLARNLYSWGIFQAAMFDETRGYHPIKSH